VITNNFRIKLVNCILIFVAILYYNQIIGLNTTLDEANQRIGEANQKIEMAMAASGADGTQTATSRADEAGRYIDGVYEGTAEGYGGPVTVQVEIKNGAISAVEVLSADHEDAAYYNMAIDVVDKILDTQDTNVDVVSGATFSSNGIINAAKQALSTAVKE
jgi:uncharacterized protein with FMN-binding domain